jgi:hypothetical protein
MAALPGGALLIAGEVQRSATEYQARLLRLDAGGGVAAVGSFGVPGVTGFAAVLGLADGSALAAGMTGFKGWLLRANGTLRPERDVVLSDADNVVALGALPNAGFAVAAAADKSTTALGVTRLSVLEADLRPRWQLTLPASGRAEPAAVAAVADGLILLGHRASTEDGPARLWVVRLRADGAIVWERQIGDENVDARSRALALFDDGEIAVAGDVHDGAQRRLQAARLASDGTVRWQRSYAGIGDSVARGLATLPDRGIVLVGSSTSQGPGKTNVRVLRLDEAGTVVWDRAFGSAD